VLALKFDLESVTVPRYLYSCTRSTFVPSMHKSGIKGLIFNVLEQESLRFPWFTNLVSKKGNGVVSYLLVSVSQFYQ
jgi:hypothetical protein